MEECEKSSVWKHKESGGTYCVDNIVPMQMADGSWVPGAIYARICDGRLFVTSLESWMENFVEVKGDQE